MYVYIRVNLGKGFNSSGMFMVCVQLTDKNGFLTSQSCRSNMLHYHSDLLYQMKVILLSPLFIFGAKEEQQTLVFELYSDFEEDQVRIRCSISFRVVRSG